MSDKEWHDKKRPDKTYVSKPIPIKDLKSDGKGGVIEEIRKLRIVSKVIDSNESYTFAKIKDELVIRKTDGGRQEIIAKLLEDNRGIRVLSFQRYTSPSGNPHEASFAFIGDEIETVFKYFQSLHEVPFDKSISSSINDNELKKAALSKEQARKIVEENGDLISEIFANDITTGDIVTLGFRKKQLKIFEQLLTDEAYFKQIKEKKSLKRDEDLWQKFFEKNTWIFGYGLNYVFNSPLEDKKLEQVVSGFDFNNSGKRSDALLKTKGIIDSLCFAEIKTHKTDLLKPTKTPYRPEVWQVSNEITGGIAQLQKTVQKSIKNISTKTEVKDNMGNLTGENLFLYSPKSYLIVGSLAEFIMENGINEDQYSSFELFRQGLNRIDVITFDELYERAKFIVHNSEVMNTEMSQKSES